MSQTHAVFLHSDGSAEVREVRLDERDRPPRTLRFPKRVATYGVTYRAQSTSDVGSSAVVDVREYRLTDSGVEYPIYLEVKP